MTGCVPRVGLPKDCVSSLTNSPQTVFNSMNQVFRGADGLPGRDAHLEALLRWVKVNNLGK